MLITTWLGGWGERFWSKEEVTMFCLFCSEGIVEQGVRRFVCFCLGEGVVGCDWLNFVMIKKCEYLPWLIFDVLCNNKTDAGLGGIACDNKLPNKRHRKVYFLDTVLGLDILNCRV